jgi:L-threonylcarbamoyladenylate synthase
MGEVDSAAAAIGDGELVVYPTETVYGLGANALDGDAVKRVFEAKGRDRDNPLSLGVPDIETALEYVTASTREVAFMREFLPGPVTVVVGRTEQVPDALTAGQHRVGVRIPDHALARDLLAAAPEPVTATSANVSGRGSVTRIDDLDPEIEDAASVVVDGGETAGAESTVVDVATETIHRRGANADAVEAWLDEHTTTESR